MLFFVKCFSHISWDDCMSFILHSINVICHICRLPLKNVGIRDADPPTVKKCVNNFSQPSVSAVLNLCIQITMDCVVSVQFSCSVVSDSLWPHESQQARPPCPSPTPRVYSNSCPSSQWCHPAISSSVIPFSSCPQFVPASGSFPVSQLFVWGGQSTGVSASVSVLPMNTQDWSSLGWTGWISLQCVV